MLGAMALSHGMWLAIGREIILSDNSPDSREEQIWRHVVGFPEVLQVLFTYCRLNVTVVYAASLYRLLELVLLSR
jgi:hypothetical protein